MRKDRGFDLGPVQEELHWQLFAVNLELGIPSDNVPAAAGKKRVLVNISKSSGQTVLYGPDSREIDSPLFDVRQGV
jgi:hypothetical protein